jgi:hypothetical protein
MAIPAIVGIFALAGVSGCGPGGGSFEFVDGG